MHEIVTLQFGQQANYVATHFWNAQESYFTYAAEEESPVNHDIHFRPGIGADGSDTFTPRTVIYDLKGAFGTLRRDNALYRQGDENGGGQQSQWPGQAQVIQQPAIPASDYQTHLDSGLEPPPLTTSTVRYWSDYNRVFYHPRSIVQIQEYELNSSVAPFERWSTGEELFSNLDREHDLLDKDLRLFLEEADHLQAVQVFASADDAWAGFAAKYVENVRDELGKTAIWVWSLEDGSRKAREKQLLQTANVMQSIYSLSNTASMNVSLTTLPRVLPDYMSGFDATSRWHTSALQMAAIETATLPSRLRSDQSSRASLDNFESLLSNGGQRRLATLDLSLSSPDAAPNGTSTAEHDSRVRPTNGHADRSETKEDIPTPLELDIHFEPTLPSSTSTRCPHRPPHNTVYSQIQSLRGLFLSSLELESFNCSSRDRRGPQAQSNRRLACYQTSTLPLPLPSSFPRIFSNAQDGVVNSRAALSAGSNVAVRLRGLLSLARSAIGVEDREALVEGLSVLAEEYEEGGWSDSDSADEDE